MALSNWLTRDEWNACYFTGLRQGTGSDLGQQLCAGIAALHQAGYKFKGIESSANGDYKKVTMCCEGNDSCLVEVMTGTLDVLGRAKELLLWAPGNLPGMDWSWLQELVTEADEEKAKTTS